MSFVQNIRARKLVSVGILSLALALGLLAGNLMNNGVRAASPAPDAKPLAVPSPVQLSNTFSQLAKRLEPSVVKITSTMVEKTSDRRGGNSMRGQDPGDLFRRFFGGDPSGGMQPFGNMPQMPFRSQATGSGFVVDPKGYILTNNHVVADASRVQVKLHDDPTLYVAKVIGRDPETDVAVLKINPSAPLHAAEIGNSDAVQVGDWAVAIGSPFGLDETVTAGIISAKGRDLGGPEHQMQRFLQTDAAINPGNSGGPLLNIRGEVIGINTAIATESGGYQGIGFALPINTAVHVYDQLIKTGKVSRGAIGISFRSDDKPELLKAYGADHGVFVQEVTPGGPADKAGVKPEDVILAINGSPVKNGDDLVSRVSESPVGSDVNLKVLRNGKPLDLKLQIGDRSEIVAGNSDKGDRGGSSPSGAVNARFGMSVKNITPRDRQQLGFDKSGVLITNVQDGSFADDIGLREGDIVTEINRQPVNSVTDVERVQRTLKPGEPVAVRVMRDAGQAQWRAFYAAGSLPPGNS